MAAVAQVFSNRYEIRSEIARGGMAEVFLAHDRLLDRVVALKVLAPDLAADPAFVERFRREAQAAARLSHPNIVAVYDWGEEDGTYYIVMEYVDGRTLRDLLRSYRRLDPMEAAHLASGIAEALAFAHQNGLVHRDIKPANVIVDASGEVKVADFGIARLDTAGADLTRTGSVMGTATYLSPEQAQGLPLDGRSDVYSLGVVLYEMLTGTPPFRADGAVQIAYKHVREEPAPPSERDPGVPAALDRIVMIALAKDVADRYQSARDMRADLMRFERGRPVLGAVVPASTAALDSGTATIAAAEVTAAQPRRPEATPVPTTSRATDQRRTGAIVATVVALGLLVALIIVLLVQSDFAKSKAPARPAVNVPSVVGKPFAEAESILKAQGLRVVRKDADSPEPADRVLSQDPEPGRKAHRGDTATLTVSAATIIVPNVVGQTREAADATLKAKGLVPTYTEQEAAGKTPGTVLSISPAPGLTVPKSGPGVSVVVAREPLVAVPDVAGLDQAAATNQLSAVGFLVKVLPTPSASIAAGKAIQTDPPAGAQAAKGSTVTIQLSTGPEQVDIPSVIGATRDEAVAALTAKGFNVAIIPPPGPEVPNNQTKVTGQSPAAGTKAAKGSTVTITVSKV